MDDAIILTVFAYVGVGALVFAKANLRNGAIMSLAIAVIWPISVATLMLQKERGN